jgi:hypothetical protein
VVNRAIIVVVRDTFLEDENFPRFWDLFLRFFTTSQDWLTAGGGGCEIGRVDDFFGASHRARSSRLPAGFGMARIYTCYLFLREFLFQLCTCLR